MSEYSKSKFNYEDKNSSWYKTFNLIPDKSVVMDIGCSAGIFGEELIKHKDCIVDGIEINPDDYKEAQKKLRKVYNLNVEIDELPQDTKYDVVFMGDVVEHLADPISALRKISQIIKPDGCLIFSIPNITHMSVRLMLLKGVIQYGKTGLLDETHLHFYNQEEIIRVFNSAGFKVVNLDNVKRDLPKEVLQKELEEIGLIMQPKFEKLSKNINAATYQFVGMAKKSEITKQDLPLKSPIDLTSKYLKDVSEKHKKQIGEIKKAFQEEIINEKKKQQEFKRQLTDLKIQLNKVINSRSYRIGRIVLLPIRVIRFVKYRVLKFVVQKRNIINVKKTIHGIYGLKIANWYSRPNVSLVVRSIEHPTSSTFIRMVSPLRHIVNEKNWKVELVDGDKPKISRSSKMIIVQRTALIDMVAANYIVEKAKKNKAKIYVDTDDAFGDLDVNHPQYDLQKQRVEALNRVISEASMVWFSTPSLQKVYKIKKSRVIRNTLDKKIWNRLGASDNSMPHRKNPLEIVYMGTKTHDGDFRIIEPVLRNLYDKYPGAFNLHIIGVGDIQSNDPWIIRHNPPSGLYPYFVEWFNSIGPFDIGIAPLEDSKFNRSKSDIKCLDYLAVGAKPIVSNVTAYQNKELDQHIHRVNNTYDEWFTALEDEITNKDTTRINAQKRSESARHYIINQRLSQVAGSEILDSLSEEVT